MFIAMNRLKVVKGSEHDFEQVWFNRKSTLSEMPGFVVFHLVKGPEREDHVLYASHTVWRSRADFEAWTKSEQFRDAHAINAHIAFSFDAAGTNYGRVALDLPSENLTL